ncbi:MAG TPA: CHAT domain-containing tetratricopeptide repeat protein [Patescibacteria group bacterium]|nr:CHAT domain-containing tetratricopeptide repeat protein [Patescibacteria group bacterium]
MKPVRYHIPAYAALAYIIISAAVHLAPAPGDGEMYNLEYVKVSGIPAQLLSDDAAVALFEKSGFIWSEKALSPQFNLLLEAHERGAQGTFAYCAVEAGKIAYLLDSAFHSRHFSLLIADLLDDERKLSAYTAARRCIVRCHDRIYDELDRAEEIETVLRESIAALEDAGCGRWTGKGLETLADYYFASGRDPEGVRCLEEALDTYRDTEHLPSVSYISGRIGAYHVRKGNFEAADAAYRLSLSNAERCGDPYYLSRALSFLGCLRGTEGFTVEAESLLVQACRCSEHACDPNCSISRNLTLARLLNSFGETNRAAGIAEKSTLLAEELLSGDSPETGIYVTHATEQYLASGLALLSRIQRAAGNLGEAIAKMEKALSIAQRGIDQHYIAELEKQLGDTYAAAGKTEEALSCYERALAVSHRLRENRRVAEYTTAMARLHFEQHRYRQAEELLDEAVRLAIEENYWMQQIESCRLLGKTKISRGNRNDGRKILAGAIALFEEESLRKPHVENRHFLVQLVDSIYDDLIRLDSETSHGADSVLFWAERSRHADPCGRSVPSMALDDSIRSCIADRAWIPECALIVQTTITPDRLILVALNRNGATHRCVAVESVTLDREVRAFIEQCGPSVSDRHSGPGLNRDRIAGITSRLYGFLIEPLAPLVESAEILCFIPDGVLRLLPFGALAARGSDRFLLESKTIFVSPSLLDLHTGSGKTTRAVPGTADPQYEPVAAPGESGGTAAPRFRAPLIVGNAVIPDLARRIYPRLDSLHYAGRELVRLQQFFENGTVLQGTGATRQALLARIERSDLVHISSHSIHYPLHSGKTALLLSPSGEITGERELSGALLDEQEILRLDLSHVRLVFLAACESVGGGTQYAQAGSGLAGAFVRSGAHMVVGSLWPIEDAAAERAVTSFYEKLWGGASSATAALCAMQREMIEKSRASGNTFDNIHLWAPLICCGRFDPGVERCAARSDQSAPTQAP